MIYLNVDFITISIFTISFVFATYFLSPDMDIDSRVFKRWGLLRFIFCPYRDLFKHRKLSHNVILGPISLLGYLACLIYIGLYLAGVPLKFDIRMVIIAAGMIVAIELHILADMFLSK